MDNVTIEPELRSLFNKLSDQIAEDTKEVELRKKRIEKNTVLLQAVKGSLTVTRTAVDASAYGAKRSLILEAIYKIPSPRFTQDQVEDAMRVLSPTAEINRDKIRASIWSMAAKGEKIRTVRKGTNSEPAQYEKVEILKSSKRPDETAAKPAEGHHLGSNGLLELARK